MAKQEYSSYRLVIVDNASKDNTLRAATRHLNFLGERVGPKIRIYGEHEAREKSETLYFATRMFCQKDEVLIFMSGGEELVGTDTLQKINSEYRNSNPLAVYSNSIFYDNKNLTIGVSSKYDRMTV